LEALYRYFVDALRQDEAEFVEKHAGLYLLRPPSDDPALDAAETGREAGDEFDNDELPLPGNELQTGSLNEESPLLNQWTVVALEKRPGFPPFNRIAIGRWTSCDVVLPFSSVSATHAYVHIAEKALVGISDRRSSHGTFVNGRKLADGEVAPIQVGDRLRFGSVELELVDVRGFLAKLKSLL
jgi:hypothetical protein